MGTAGCPQPTLSYSAVPSLHSVIRLNYLARINALQEAVGAVDLTGPHGLEITGHSLGQLSPTNDSAERALGLMTRLVITQR